MYPSTDGREADDAAPVDPHSLAELCTKYRAHLLRMVEFRLDDRLASRIDPADVLQEAFLNAQQRLPHIADLGTVPPLVWLRQITEQTLIDLERRHLGAQRRAVSREVVTPQPGVGQTTSISLAAMFVGDLSSPSQVVLRDERRTLLQQALEQMDPIDREVLALRHFEELSNLEVAQILGLQPTAASNRYIRALQRLKQIVESISALVLG